MHPCFDIYVQMLGQLWNVGSNKCSGASSISAKAEKTDLSGLSLLDQIYMPVIQDNFEK